MIKKILAGIFIVAIIGAFTAYSFIYRTNANEDPSGAPRNAFPVEIEESFTMTIVTEISVKGTVSLIDRHIMYPKSGAKIKNVHAKTGDAVTEGDVLVEYEDDSLDNLYDQMKELNLNYESARIRLDATVLPPSRTELMQAEMNINQAELGVNQAEANISQAEANINQAKKTITDIHLSVDTYDINIEQMNRNIEQAEKTLDETQILYDVGAVTKNELDNLAESLTKMREQLLTTSMQRDNTVLSLDNAETALNNLESALPNVKAALPNAQASLELAREQYNSILNRPNEEGIQNQIKQNQISLDQILLRVQQLQKQIDDFVFFETAPASGTVLTRNANEGEYSSSNRPLFEIADTSNDNLVIKAAIPEKEIAGIYEGQEAVITGSALGRDKFTGTITKIYPMAEQRQISNSVETVVLVDICVTDENAKLKSGYTVDANIVTAVSEDVVVVPLMSTLSESGGDNFVYIMNDEFIIEKRMVDLLTYSGLYVEVTNVKAGEKIVQSPPQQLADGMLVRPITR